MMATEATAYCKRNRPHPAHWHDVDTWCHGRPAPGQPVAPSDVRIELHGTTYLLDDTLTYLGVSEGAHRWRVYGPPHLRWRPDIERMPGILIGELPGNTGVELGIRHHSPGWVGFELRPQTQETR